MKIRKGDTVMVRSGHNAGKTGKVLSTNKDKQTVIIEGVNIYKHHRKSTQTNVPGGVFEEARPLHVSKVGIVNPSKKGATSRIGIKIDKDGKKTRVYRQANDKEIK